jgi:chromodomain-helicase-DNA-binding protein 1
MLRKNGFNIHALRAGAGIEVHEEDEDATLYQIKWLGKAYRHNTWESERSLLEAEVKGMQKLQNYIRDKGRQG